jgi:hypothetical protein
MEKLFSQIFYVFRACAELRTGDGMFLSVMEKKDRNLVHNKRSIADHIHCTMHLTV